MGKFDFTGRAASEAMVEGLVSAIRNALRERIMERIEPDVNAAVDAGLETFKAHIEGFKNPDNFGATVRVLIERRDKET